MPFTNNPNSFYQNQYTSIPQSQNLYQQPSTMQDYYVPASSYESVITYPQAPNTRIWFIDEMHGKVYRKVRDIQGGVPFIDKKYSLVEDVEPQQAEVQCDEGVLSKLQSEIDRLTKEIESIKPVIEELQS